MHLTVIGSSPAWPNPGSAHSGYLVEGQGALLLDCGPGVLARLRERENRSIDAIAITHFHLDHWGDLVPWAWLAAYGPDAGNPRPELWVPPDGVRALHRFASLWGNDGMFERAFDVREFERETPFRAAGFEVAAVPVAHYDLDAFGFRVSSGGKTLAYSGDSGPCRPLSDLARGADLFVCEATLESADADGPLRGHLTASEALTAGDGPTLLTHRPVELPQPDGAALAYDGFTLQI
ncbi:MAG TPA: MBL fold metallo-hydrolase [Gaiellaceae bacterium]|nr:MBL fold metallo-hydrolase [Gaiellaceae bacterium]